MRTIAVLNQKGGVGKTTTAVNLSAALAKAGQRVCLLDLDPQAHASLHVGFLPGSHGPTMYDVLTGDTTLAQARIVVDENLWLIGSHIDLAAAEVELVGVVGREVILRDKLVEDDHSDGAPEFDYMIIDCPPSLGVLTLNALAAADEVLLPLQPHFLALHGLSKLLQTIELVNKRINDRLTLTGVVLCLYESGTRLANEVSSDVQGFFQAQKNRHPSWAEAITFTTRIRRNIRLAEAPSFGQTIFQYSADSHGAADYTSLAEELLSIHESASLKG